jgi:hypothetical protein
MYHLIHDDLQELAERLSALIPQPLPRWLTFKEACEYARVKRGRMDEMIGDGSVHGGKKKGCWIADRKSIDDYYLMDRNVPITY